MRMILFAAICCLILKTGFCSNLHFTQEDLQNYMQLRNLEFYTRQSPLVASTSSSIFSATSILAYLIFGVQFLLTFVFLALTGYSTFEQWIDDTDFVTSNLVLFFVFLVDMILVSSFLNACCIYLLQLGLLCLFVFHKKACWVSFFIIVGARAVSFLVSLLLGMPTLSRDMYLAFVSLYYFYHYQAYQELYNAAMESYKKECTKTDFSLDKVPNLVVLFLKSAYARFKVLLKPQKQQRNSNRKKLL